MIKILLFLLKFNSTIFIKIFYCLFLFSDTPRVRLNPGNKVSILTLIYIIISNRYFKRAGLQPC